MENKRFLLDMRRCEGFEKMSRIPACSVESVSYGDSHILVDLSTGKRRREDRKKKQES